MKTRSLTNKKVVDFCFDKKSLNKITLSDIGYKKHYLANEPLLNISTGYKFSYNPLEIFNLFLFYFKLISPISKIRKIVFTKKILFIYKSRGFRFFINQIMNHFRCKFNDLKLLSQLKASKNFTFHTTLIASNSISDIKLIYAHVGYTKDKIFVASIYCDMLSRIQAHIIIDQEKISIIHNKNIDRRIITKYQNTNGTKNIKIKDIQGFASDLIKHMISNLKLEKRKDSNINQINSLAVGLRNNFGHCLINYSSSLNLLNFKNMQKYADSITVSNSDFLNFSSLPFFNRYQKIFLALNNSKKKIYCTKGKRLLTLETKLPNLDYLYNAHYDKKIRKKSEDKNLAIYINLDERKGSRYLINLRDICSELIKITNSNLTIIIDKNTYKDANGKKKDLENGTSISKELLELFSKVKYVNIDNWSLGEKIKLLSKYYIPISIATMGSSLMIPIYILNNKIITFSSKDVKESLMGLNFWHIGPLCHLNRLNEFIKIVDSKSDSNGVFVSVKSFSLIFNKYLNELEIKN